MYTAMALVAVTMGNLTTTPTWLDDYTSARTKVTVAGKPMAVFVGAGKEGHAAAIRDGFDPAVSKLLAEKFVCLYVDSATAKGKVLAQAFQVGDRGVVLSDRTGLTQAYSATGTISRAELSKALVAYADVEVAQKTDTPKVTTSGTTSSAGSAPMAVPVQGGPMMAPPGAMMVGPGGPMMAPPAGYMPGPAVMGGGNWGGYGYGGGCGQSAGGCGHGMGHGCCFFGGGGGGCGHSMGGCGGGMSHGCGSAGGGWGGGKCCGLFGGFGGGMGHGCGMGGWGGGCGGGMGHGCGGCK
jgi:hypothetical protein